jgi:hypothetical protein
LWDAAVRKGLVLFKIAKIPPPVFGNLKNLAQAAPMAGGWCLAYAASWLQIARNPPPVFGNLSQIRDTSNYANGAQG